MRGLQTTMFVLLFLVVSTQTLRHVYVKWIEPTGSVLDKFHEPVKADIAASRDLDDLERLYAKAREAQETYEKDRELNDTEPARSTVRDAHREADELRGAILRLEEQERDLFQLRFYWACGLLGVLLGLLAYARLNPWVGVAGVIAGFVEMAVWTSPLWRSSGPQHRFDALLLTKLVLSAITFVLLLAVWLWSERIHRRATA
jgi:hypothetical protein